jgi:hypothetical protein
MIFFTWGIRKILSLTCSWAIERYVKIRLAATVEGKSKREAARFVFTPRSSRRCVPMPHCLVRRPGVYVVENFFK